MYYTDITNEELQYFHNRPVHNFTAKLTDVLSSDLFQIEEIITNSIYKIYPLFYTNEITSSNSNDRILDNKVIICQKLEDETYLTFKSNDGEIIDFTDYGTYYNIGDSLTMAQFNAYISLLRQNITHSDEIHIKDTVNGVYGNYIFDINNATLIDTGLVITDETIQAQPKVKLTDNVFSNSNYVLKLDVIHYTGANILDDTTSDYKVVDTIEVELVTDEWVNIPVETLQQDYIISLNATVDIDHKKPVIYIPDYELTLTSDKDIIQTDETANLTATLTLDGEPLTGETVNFKVYKTSDQSLVETLTGTTDSQGIATVSYVGEGTGVLNIQCEASERMILSETYEVIDAVLRDGGVTGDKNNNAFAYNTTYITVATDSTGTTVENTESTSGNFRAFTSRNPTDNSYLWNGDYCIELDIISSSSSSRVQLYVDNNNFISRTVEELGISNGGHLKIEYKDGVASYYVNNGDTPTYSRTLALSNYNIRFFLPSTSTFSYKNFVVYPI